MARKSGIGQSGKKSRKYYQHNYVDIIKTITPDLYTDTDYAIYGTEEDVSYTLLGKLFRVIDNVSSIFSVSATSASSLQQRFILKNNLTNITPNLFENKILKALGSSFNQFTNKSEFKSYVSSTLLPEIHANTPTSTFITGIQANVDSSVSSAALTHQFLLDNLSWAYILNTSGPATGTDPSALITENIANLFDNKTIIERDAIKTLFSYLWNNREISNSFSQYIPHQFSKINSSVSANTHTSGTQQLSNIHTLVDIWYNPRDTESETVDTYLDLYLNTPKDVNTGSRSFTPKQIEAGAFSKFLQAVGYAFYDINSTVSDIEDLVDIERCPPQFLQYLASLIGWRLLTGDVDRWRAQLRKAVYLYKSKGTRRCLEDAISLVFPGSSLNIVENLTETWELYLPRMLYYLISTESKVLNDGNYNATTIKGIPLDQFFESNLDLNCKTAVDYVIKTVHDLTSSGLYNPEGGAIYHSGKKFSLSSWDPNDVDFNGFEHRGKSRVQVPPWEDDRFYDNTHISLEQIEILNELLTAPRDASSTYAPSGGLEIPSTYVSNLSSILLKTNLQGTKFDQPWNTKWKSYTSSLEVAPNLSSLISTGESSKLSLLDNWCSKSSFVFSKIDLNDIQYNIEGVSLSTGNIMGNIASIFTSFIPFHVVFKLFGEYTFDEDYSTIVDDMCAALDISFKDLTASGDTDQTVLANLNPSSVTVVSSTITEYPNTRRTTGRRRNLKYSINPPLFTRNGRGMPIPRNYVSTSGSEPSGVAAFNVHSNEFIPLGYNFSSGKYFTPSGSMSGIYDASNDLAMTSLPIIISGDNSFPGTEYYLPAGRANKTNSAYKYDDIFVSSTFPCRAPHGGDCSTARNRNEISDITQVIISKLIYQGLTDDFSEDVILNFEFGPKLQTDFRDTNGVYASSTFIVDNVLDDIPYSENDVKIIYSYFNSLVVSKQSRDQTYSFETFTTSGGTRGYYIENKGGTTYRDGVADTASPYGSGVNYELHDT